MNRAEASGESFELENYFSWRAFAFALASFSAVFLLLVLASWFFADSTLKARQDRLTSVTVLIDRTAVRPLHEETVNVTEEKEPADLESDRGQQEQTVVYPEPERYDNGMVIAPLQGLYEETEAGLLPVIRQDSLSPFQAYSKPFDTDLIPSAKALISVVLVDFGLSGKMSEMAVTELPDAVTLVLSPYAADPQDWQKSARASGHELWLSLPLEPENPLEEDTGPLTLMTGTALDINLSRLNSVLSRASGYVGVIGPRKTEFYKSELEAQKIIKTIFGRGLAYADAGTQLQRIPQTLSLSSDKPYVYGDVWIDDLIGSPGELERKLEQLTDIAIDRGYMVAFMSPVPASMNAVAKWIKKAEKQNILFAPLSVQTWKNQNQ